MKEKMKVEIWSDVVCPFCYLGKRKFEKALEEFDHKDQVEVEWHSFQLNPYATSEPGKDVYTHLAEMKGQSRDWSIQAHQRITAAAKEEGLDYNFDVAVIANTFDAHRLIQMAKSNGLGDQAEELLFKSYFTEGKDIGDHPTLVQLGKIIGLDEFKVKAMLESNAFATEVKRDLQQAQELGIRGVPFFVLDHKYAVSGSQPSELFLQALQQSFDEWKKKNGNSITTTLEGESCGPESDCV